MPEGDTIHRVADRLRPALAGQALERFEAPRAVGPRPALGSAITQVEAKGKHLLIHFSDGVTLHTHLRMTGTWHLYRSGSRWRLPGHLARAVVGVADWEAVCFKAPVVDLYREPPPHLPQPLDHLGPDLCPEDPPVEDVLARMAATGTTRSSSTSRWRPASATSSRVRFSGRAGSARSPGSRTSTSTPAVAS